MRLHARTWTVFATLSAGCVQYNTQNNTAALSVAATVTTVNVAESAESPGARLANVPEIPSVAGARVDADTIRNTLDPYGNWVDDGTYGVVWMPSVANVGTEFVPYGSQGQWAITDMGWYWQSRYTWGWLPFHYGRWVMIRESWAWVPGSRFAPAWVDWRLSSEYVGWAPLPPTGAEFMAPYAFCRYEELVEVEVWSRVVYGPAAAMFYGQSTSLASTYGIGGGYYSWGPSPSQVGYSTASVVPIGTVWNTETAGARGNPVTTMVTGGPTGGGGGTTMPTVVPGSGTAPTLNPSQGGIVRNTQVPSPNVPTYAGPPTVTGGTSPTAGPRPMGVGANPAIAGAGPAPVRVRPSEVAFDPAAYRPPQTVVIRSSVPVAPPRTTVSLGTTSPYVGPPAAGASTGGYVSPSGYSPPSYASPVRPVYAPSGGGYVAPRAGPTYAQPSPSYSPPVRTYSPPVVPSYNPPHVQPVAYSPPHVTYTPHAAQPAAYHVGYAPRR